MFLVDNGISELALGRFGKLAIAGCVDRVRISWWLWMNECMYVWVDDMMYE